MSPFDYDANLAFRASAAFLSASLSLEPPPPFARGAAGFAAGAFSLFFLLLSLLSPMFGLPPRFFLSPDGAAVS